MLRRGRGEAGFGVCLIELFLYYVHRPSAEMGNSLYFHARSLFQIYYIVYTQIYNIYQNNNQGKCWPWYSCIISKHVYCMQDKIGKSTLSYYFNDRIIVK